MITVTHPPIREASAAVRNHALTIDMVKLRARLTHTAGREVTFRQVTDWLRQNGFALADRWMGDDAALCRLFSDEVLTHRELLVTTR